MEDSGTETDTLQEKANGTSWLLWIGGLSILNSIVQLIGIHFIFGLAFTDITDVLLFYWFGTIYPSLITSILISSLFIAAYYLSNKGHKWAFIASYSLYACDALVCVIIGFSNPEAFILVGAHAIPLTIMAMRYNWEN